MSLDLEGGTGGILAMCGLKEFMEVYKEDRTYRVRSPESVDPARTNPNAPFVASVAADVGSASPVVARVFLQGQEMLSAAALGPKVVALDVLQLLHDCKEDLVVCESVAARVASRVDAVSGQPFESAQQVVNPLPQVEHLDADVTAFLIHAKRAVRAICRLPTLFIALDRKDHNFDALAESLSATVGGESPLTQFVQERAPGVRHLIHLRNQQEHPDTQPTVVENFAVRPDGNISVPMWYVTGDAPRPIGAEMRAAVNFLIEVSEEMLMHLLLGAADERIPFVIEEIDPTKVNPKMPVRFRLSVAAPKGAD